MNDFNTKAYAKNDVYNTGGMDWLIQNRNNTRNHVICALELAKIRRQILGKSVKIQTIKKNCLDIFANVYRLHDIEVQTQENGVYLKNKKKEIPFDTIQDFIKGYEPVSQDLY